MVTRLFLFERNISYFHTSKLYQFNHRSSQTTSIMNTTCRTLSAFALGATLLLMPAPIRAQTGDREKDRTAIEKEYLEMANKNIEKYRKGDALLEFRDTDRKPLKDVRVEIEQTGHDFLFGCQVNAYLTRMMTEDKSAFERFEHLFLNVFNFAVITPFWRFYEREPGMTRWEEYTRAAEWCLRHNITPKISALIWAHSNGCPDWLPDIPREDHPDMVKSYLIRTTAGYRDKVGIFDVVNEAVHTIPFYDALLLETRTNADRYDYELPVSRQTDWVDECFRWAHEGNPEATLILNDYYQIYRDNDRQRFIELVKALREEGTPVNGLGIQAHEPDNVFYSPEQYWTVLNEIGELGYPLHITELTPTSADVEIAGDWRTGKWDEQTQADFIEMFFTLSFAHPDVVSVNCWAFSDRRSWLRGGGFVDDYLRPKESYRTASRLINEEWHTSISARTGQKGRLPFRGFYGKYKVTVTTPDNRIRSYLIHLSEQEENKWRFFVP